MKIDNMFDNIKAFVFDVDGVFTDGSVLAMPDGDLLRTFNAKDCFAVRMAVDNGYPVSIITGGCSQSIIHRATSLGVEAKNLYQLSRDKRPDFLKFCSDYGLQPSEVVFVGDDVPDIPALREAGLAVCPSDAVSEVKAACNYISPFPGGRGCIRDIVEKVLKMQGKWNFDPTAPISANYPDHITQLATKTGRNV